MQIDFEKAAQVIANADALLITAGAGMGVDSGLPDFRGDKGFWKAYPPFEKLGLNFYDLADPVWFDRKPKQAWGFYGHRLNLYSATEPHAGFGILKKWASQCELGSFVFTSNVDGHFQRAGFEEAQVIECHGAIGFLQCSVPCGHDIWSAEGLEISIDESNFLADEPLPMCRNCLRVARPNVLMFGDGSWVPSRTEEQADRYKRWLQKVVGSNFVIIELGAGTSVPTVRYESERRCQQLGGTLVRINPRESQGPRGAISIASEGLKALKEIDHWLERCT